MMSPRRGQQSRSFKQPHPCRVKDPISDSHVVYLTEKQKFEVFLSNDHVRLKGCTVRSKSEYLTIEGVKSVPGGLIYTFKQVGDLEHWSRVSTTFLGEVQFSDPSGKFNSRICAFLKASNPLKNNIVTVVNPNGHTVKLQPYQILEVVVYNPVWGMPLYWEADVSEDPRFEVLSHTYIQPHEYDPDGAARKINDAFFTYARAAPASTRPFLEYHFWLRCDTITAKHMQSMPEGSFPNGKIRFLGCIDTKIKTSLDINIIFNARKQKDITSDRSQVVTFEDSDMTKDVIQLKKPGTDIIPITELTKKSVYSSGTTNDWTSYARSGMQGAWGSSREYYDEGYSYHYAAPRCTAQKFTVKQLTTPMFHGCKIQYLEDINICKFMSVI